MKSLFEQMGVTYRTEGEYLVPNITLHNKENHPIGIWGERVPEALKTATEFYHPVAVFL